MPYHASTALFFVNSRSPNHARPHSAPIPRAGVADVRSANEIEERSKREAEQAKIDKDLAFVTVMAIEQQGRWLKREAEEAKQEEEQSRLKREAEEAKKAEAERLEREAEEAKKVEAECLKRDNRGKAKEKEQLKREEEEEAKAEAEERQKREAEQAKIAAARQKLDLQRRNIVQEVHEAQSSKALKAAEAEKEEEARLQHETQEKAEEEPLKCEREPKKTKAELGGNGAAVDVIAHAQAAADPHVTGPLKCAMENDKIVTARQRLDLQRHKIEQEVQKAQTSSGIKAKEAQQKATKAKKEEEEERLRRLDARARNEKQEAAARLQHDAAQAERGDEQPRCEQEKAPEDKKPSKLSEPSEARSGLAMLLRGCVLGATICPRPPACPQRNTRPAPVGVGSCVRHLGCCILDVADPPAT